MYEHDDDDYLRQGDEDYARRHPVSGSVIPASQAAREARLGVKTYPDGKRVGDADRDRVCRELGYWHGLGHLTADEFDARSDAARKAVTEHDLTRLGSDLPPMPGPDEGPPPVPLSKTLGRVFSGKRGALTIGGTLLATGATMTITMISEYNTSHLPAGTTVAAWLGAIAAIIGLAIILFTVVES